LRISSRATIGVTQVDDDTGAIGSLDPPPAARIAQPDRTGSAAAWLPVFLAPLTPLAAFVLMGWGPNERNLSVTAPSRKAVYSKGLRIPLLF